ncbi:MAG: hypothetical protein MI725_15435, partial [Pirellulales bacterium]|nr:hypothetical protein [Pirellulales bacterium]
MAAGLHFNFQCASLTGDGDRRTVVSLDLKIFDRLGKRDRPQPRFPGNFQFDVGTLLAPRGARLVAALLGRLVDRLKWGCPPALRRSRTGWMHATR